MPLPVIRPIRATLARLVWRRVADDVINLAVDLVNDGITPEEAIDFGLSVGLEALDTAGPALVRAAGELGERIDDALTWGWVKNADRRAWLEAHDDLSPFLRALARRALAALQQEAGQTTRPLR
jgi:hypothetical protein